MQEELKEQILILRKAGMKPRKIAQYTSAPVSSTWTLCKESGMDTLPTDDELLDKISSHEACAYCGHSITQPATGRPRFFCSDACRRAYWKLHRPELKKNPESIYTKVCPYCGKTFQVYGNKKRKYCCHEHYVLARFGSTNNKEV
jgi:endogenous inhibitor of DNA gyrase (YacG/DUF329 family)